MKIFDIFKLGRTKLPRIDHIVFGTMEATLVNDDGSYYWETPDSIVTAKGNISVFTDGSVYGPSDEQVRLWHWIYENSEYLKELATPLLCEELKGFGCEAQISDLVWSAAGLSPDGDRDGAWDMSFTLSKVGKLEGAIFTAYFRNGTPTVVSVDD